MPPTLDDSEDLNHSILYSSHTINKYETIHQITTFSNPKFFNKFVFVEDAILKRFSKWIDQRYIISSSDMPSILLVTLKEAHCGSSG